MKKVIILISLISALAQANTLTCASETIELAKRPLSITITGMTAAGEVGELKKHTKAHELYFLYPDRDRHGASSFMIIPEAAFNSKKPMKIKINDDGEILDCDLAI